MNAHDWDWTAIVNPQLVERALDEQERRARRRLLRAGAGSAAAHDHDESRPVAA